MENLETILYLSWDEKTSYKKSKKKWSIEHPYIGQCAVTALVVNDLLGGAIMKVKVGDENHYYNVVDDQIIDYTKKQYKNIDINYAQGKLVNRSKLLKDLDTKYRYYLLAKSVRYNIELYNTLENERETKIHELKLEDRVIE